MNLDESLPSHSAFIVPGRGQNQLGNFMDHTVASYSSEMQDGRGSPPPPPPPSVQSDLTFQAAVKPVSSANQKPRSNSRGIEIKPFLRKNSRKEPSALHRINSPSKSPTNDPWDTARGAPTGHSPNQDSRSTPATAVRRDLHNEHDYEDDGYEDHDDDVFLAAPGAHSGGNPQQQQNRNSYARASQQHDTLDQSTINIAGPQWQQQRNAVQNELDEFEQIEKHLENSTSYNPSAVRGSMQTSQQLNSRPATQQPARSAGGAHGNTMHSEDSYGGDWDDAYEHEPFDSTKKSFGLNTITSYALDESVDSGGEAQYSEHGYDRLEEQPVQRSTRPVANTDDFPSSDQDDMHDALNNQRTRVLNETATRSSATRPSQEHESEYNYNRERSVSPNAGASARIGGVSQASAARPSESPSWGRVTQPSGESYASHDYNPPPMERSNSSEQREQAMKGARMSNSALKKISSRTAALHHQPAQHRVERPALADDTNAQTFSRDEEYSEQDEPVRDVVYTRPVSAQRRLASTHSAGAVAAGTAKPRSGSAGGRLSNRGSGADSAAKSQDILSEKARDLEAELETYRSENANLKKLRRQQEVALAEVVSQKEELMRWVAEEKARTIKWCEEQQAAATKERNAAAKMARDSRQKALSGTVPIRKEKAEIEGLQATIEKMKVDHEQAAKKWKLSENRLYALVKEHVAHIETSEKQLLTLEQEKLQLLEFIGEQGLRLPKPLRSALQRTPLYRSSPDTGKPGSTTTARGAAASSTAMDVIRGKSSQNRGRSADDGYAEEVDVDFTDGTSSSYYALAHSAEGGGGGVRSLGVTIGSSVDQWDRESKESRPTKSPASPKSKGSNKLAATLPPGEIFNRQSNNLRSGHQTTSATARDASSTMSNKDLRSAQVSSSWARSSGGSRSSAGRYDDAESDDTVQHNVHRDQHSPTKAASSGPGSASHKVGAASQSGGMLKQTLRDPHHHHGPPDTSGAGTAGSAHDASAGRTEKVLPDGRKIIKYKNGTEKEVDATGSSMVRFLNGDTKSVNATSGVVVYYYAQAETTHTTFKDGLEVYEFPNKQVEMHFPDGIKEIIFPDGTRKVINPDGMQESHFPDGVVLREHTDGRKEVLSADA